MIVEYHRKPQGKVLQAYSDCRATRSFIMGPLGSGKTTETVLKIFDLMIEQDPVAKKSSPFYKQRISRWVAVRNTYSELMSTTIKDWLSCHGDLGRFKEGAKEPPNHRIMFKLDDGTTVNAEIYFIAFDRPDDVKKARGLQLTGAWLNEVKELPKSIVDMLDLRIGRYPSNKEGATPTWAGILGDTNAPSDDHWFYKLAEEQKPDGWMFHRQPGGLIKTDGGYMLNPLAENISNLPDDYYTRGMSGKTTDWIDVNLCNEYGYVVEGKPVHPRYIDSVHCVDIDYKLTDNPIVLGFDFGRTPACALLQQGPMDRWVCFDEFVSENMSAATFAPELKKYINKHYANFKGQFIGWGDPSGGRGGEATEDSAHKIIRANGLPCNPTQSNNPILRRNALESCMTDMCLDGKPRFVLLPKCSTIRKGLKGGFCYRRIQTSGEKFSDVPDKNQYSHPVEALEYALQGQGEGRPVIKQHTTAPMVQPKPIRPIGTGARPRW